MHAQLQETPLCHAPATLQMQRSSTTLAQRKHVHWRMQTLVWNTAGQKGTPKPRTAHQMLKGTLNHAKYKRYNATCKRYKRAIRNYNT